MKWEEPPPVFRGGRPSVLEPLIEELKQHPGRWALFEECSTKGVAGGWSFRLRKLGAESVTRGTKVYARWPEAK